MLEPGRQEGERARLALPILIEGAGDWVENAFMRALEEYLYTKPVGPHLTVVIADDSRWYAPGARRPVLPKSGKIAEAIKQGKVVFLDKAAPAHLQRYQQLRPGIVFVVTPDYTHAMLCREHLDRTLTIFVEKPFDANYDNVQQLLQARGLAALDTEIYALDHYRFYAWRLKEPMAGGPTVLEAATTWLGGALRRARFCMVEQGPVEANRLRALQYGLMLDMLPHCFAMLAFFGKVDSVDELRVLHVGRYTGAPIARETYAQVACTFEDYSDNGWRVPCAAWIGKGLKHERKFFEVEGRNGQSVLIVLGAKTLWGNPERGYPDREVEGGMYFVDATGTLTQQAELDRDRYKQLLVDCVEGTRKAIVCAMPLRAGARIVHALDRLWGAIQSHSPWRPYEFREVDCFDI